MRVKVLSAFILGRSAFNNILVTFEVMHCMKSRRGYSKGIQGIKINMNKAYEQVEWSYVEVIILTMGFDLRWVGLISRCIRSVSYYVVFEDGLIGPIYPNGGLRQGDSLSLYLFILYAKGLSLTKDLVRQGVLNRVWIARGAPLITNLLFTNDSLFFNRASLDENRVWLEILETYGRTSCQLFNIQNSMVSLGET